MPFPLSPPISLSGAEEGVRGRAEDKARKETAGGEVVGRKELGDGQGEIEEKGRTRERGKKEKREREKGRRKSRRGGRRQVEKEGNERERERGRERVIKRA